MTSRASTPPLPAAILFAYLGFIVYGSLVPLDFTPQSIATAWQRFQQTPMLQLGVESRADWIANGILYIPAGFLAAEWLSGLLPPRARVLALLLALVGCSALAFGVEFAQIFFPPRTVSQNDILAECLGSLGGITLAAFMAHLPRQLVAYRPASREAGITLLLAAYLAGYLAFSFFPYDLLLSGAELAAKFNSDNWGILLAGSKADGRLAVRLARIGLEVAAVIPFGIFMIRRSKGAAPSAASVLLPGALLGLGIELAQFFMYTGSSEGLSVITRALGAYAGALLWLRGRHIDPAQIALIVKRASLVLTPFYLLGLATVSGWFSQHWQSPGAAMAAFETTRLMPFYYHYYTSEAIALGSLVSNAALYAPVGIVAWAWNRPGSAAASLAALLALIIETSRLFFSTTHADPTNLLIAAVAAWATTALAGRLFATIDPSTTAEGTEAEGPPHAGTTARPGLVTRHLATLVLAGGFSAYWLAHFPVQPLALALGLLACAAATWFRPIVMVALIPAALPILDLAPWSGRFFLDEFDILLLITLAIGYARTRPASPAAPGAAGNRLLNLALGMLVLSFAISTAIALLPLPALDANSFTSYFSPFNALRISKGLLWAVLFIGLVRRVDPAGMQSFRWFAGGMTLGLAVTAAVVIREKELFGGLLDFSTEYRATGPFSAIHTGGAYIEAYLAAAVPFLIYAILHARNWLGRLLGTVVFAATTYALVATVSRGGFAGYAIACGLALVAALAGRGGRYARLGLGVVLAASALAVAVPLMQGTFVQQRLASTATDLAARRAHWADGLAMRQGGLLTELFGMGIGRFPITHYLGSRETASHTSMHALVAEASNTFLRIAPGNALYVEQIIEIEPRQHYLLSFDFRSATPASGIGISVCEKWLLAANRCATLQKGVELPQRNGWQPLEYSVDSGELGSGRWLDKRPVKLSFYSTAGAVADIDNIRLARSAGPALIVNGDFSHGMDRWYFATDKDLAWHLHSTPVDILFAQGWFGVLCWGAFAAIALGLAIQAAWRGSPAAGIYAAATAGWIVVSLMGSVIDVPRLLFLCVVLAVLGAQKRRA